MRDPWDAWSDVFSGKLDEEDIPVDAADNILLAWPAMFAILKDFAPAPGAVLDFGCGGGRFANELRQRGYNTSGIDTSEQMIDNARWAFGDQIEFTCGDASALTRSNSFRAIVSVMVMQFIEDVERTIRILATQLTDNGILLFAVHNPAYIKGWIERGKRMIDFDSRESPRRGFLQFNDDVRVPIYVRTVDDYDQLATSAGLKRVAEATPPFTNEFLDRFPTARRGPVEHPEFLILGYAKIDKSS